MIGLKTQFPFLKLFRLKFFLLLLFFLKEFVLANVQVILLLFRKNEDIQPAIVMIPLRLKSDLQILFLANMITLTPGTLTLSHDPEKEVLFVHVIHTDDPSGVVASIQTGFEQRIHEAFL